MKIPARIKILYLYGATLYALLAIIFIFTFSDSARIAADGNQFVIDGKVKLYWGALFGPVFLFFTFPPVLNALRNMKSSNGLEVVFFLWLAMDLISFVVGAVKGNSIRYLISDTFVLSIIPLCYFLVKEHVRDVAQVRSFFYFILVIQFFLILFPVNFGVVPSFEGMASIGLYTFHSTEAFVTVSLMLFALFSRNRWLCIGLLVIAIAVSSYRVRTIYVLQIFAAAAIVFSIHIFSRGFFKRFATMLIITFISLSLLWGLGLLEKSYLGGHAAQSIYKKTLQSYVTVHRFFKKLAEDVVIKVAEGSTLEKRIGAVGTKEETAKVSEKPAEDAMIKVAKPRWEIGEVGGIGEYESESLIKKIGEKSLKLHNMDTKKPFYAELRISDYYKRFHFDGRKIIFGCWVYSTTPGKIHIGILDFSNTHSFLYSPFHSGGGQWEFLTVSKTIRDKSEIVQLQLFAEGGGVGYFDGAIAIEGNIAVDTFQHLVGPDNDLLEHFETIQTKDHSLSQRFYEANVVKDIFKESGPWEFLFGFGNGATIDLSKTPDITMRLVYQDKINAIHAIHFLPLAVLYRQGIVGLSVFLFMVAAIVLYFIRMISYFKTLDESAIIAEILFLNIFMVMLAGFTATPHFFTSITAGFGLGLIGVIRHTIGKDKNISAVDKQ